VSVASGARLGMLFAVISLLAWLVWQPPAALAPAPVELPDELIGQPDLYMLDAQITQFTSAGTVKYVLDSEHVRHFETDGMTRLTAPELALQGDAQAPWHVTAEQGFIRREPSPAGEIEEIVYLRRNVRLKQRLNNGQFMTLRSDSLYIYPDRQLAQTSEGVMIDTEGGRTTGTDLAIDLASSRLDIRSQPPKRVQTIILPDQFK